VHLHVGDVLYTSRRKFGNISVLTRVLNDLPNLAMDGLWERSKVVEGLTSQDSPSKALNAVEQTGVVTVIQEYDRVTQSGHSLGLGM
jgi:hypothetical protein